MIAVEAKLFKTSNVDLASFLILEGVKLIELQASLQRDIIEICFLDEKQNCSDLERVYLSSEFKKFRDINKYMLKRVHSKIRELKTIEE